VTAAAHDVHFSHLAELADQVLPSLTAAMRLLAQDPAEADHFRSTVLIAVDAAARSRTGPTAAAMLGKITAALRATGSTAGPDRPELQQILEGIVESGITGITLRLRDGHGEWIGSAGVAELGATAKPPVDGHVRIGSNTDAPRRARAFIAGELRCGACDRS
jgi:D-alanyl-D-alanine carboxypeptidase